MTNNNIISNSNTNTNTDTKKWTFLASLFPFSDLYAQTCVVKPNHAIML